MSKGGVWLYPTWAVKSLRDRIIIFRQRVREGGCGFNCSSKEFSTTIFQRYWTQVNMRGVVGSKGVNVKDGLFVGSL